MPQKSSPMDYTEEETARRADAALRVALNTPHKPHKPHKGASKNCDQPSVTKESPPNDSGLFSLRFIGVLAVDVAVGACRQFFEVPHRTSVASGSTRRKDTAGNN